MASVKFSRPEDFLLSAKLLNKSTELPSERSVTFDTLFTSVYLVRVEGLSVPRGRV